MNPKRLKPFRNRLIMLERQNSCRNNDCNLLSGSHSLKNSTHSNFCLTKPDITANKPIHRLFTFHIGLNIVYRLHLIRSFGVFKRFFHLNLPICVRQKLNSMLHFTFCIKSQKIIRNLFNLFFDTGFGIFPIFSAHSRKFRFYSAGSTIAHKQVNLLSRNMQPVFVCIFNSQIIFELSVNFLLRKPFINSDTMNTMNNVFSLFYVVNIFDIFRFFLVIRTFLRSNFLVSLIEKFSIGKDYSPKIL